MKKGVILINTSRGKIIETGSLTKDDQNEINRIAFSSTFSDKDAEAVQKLTNMITEGRVSVLN